VLCVCVNIYMYECVCICVCMCVCVCVLDGCVCTVDTGVGCETVGERKYAVLYLENQNASTSELCVLRDVSIVLHVCYPK